MTNTQEKVPLRPKYWVRLALFIVCAVAALIGSNVAYSILNTLSELDQIEAARDEWQRPSDVIQALNLKDGDSVVDLGCGSGYFSLKLSQPVGREGNVLAEDIRRLPLAFLWVRAARKGKHNVSVLLGDVEDPHLAPASANAVLISNTYHEFTAPKSILEHVRQFLRPGGRIVIIDRTPRTAEGSNEDFHGHEIASERVEADLRQADFAIESRCDNFIANDPEHGSWWMIVARHP